MQVREILEAKSTRAVIVGPDDAVRTASSRIAEMGKGLAVVCDQNDSPIAILSVIDINRAIAEFGDQAPGVAVREIMNTNIVACEPDDPVEQALDRMMERGIHHLPVVAEGRLKGIVNVQQLLEARFSEAQFGLEEMRRYVFGAGYG